MKKVWTLWIEYRCKEKEDIVFKFNTQKQAESAKIKADKKYDAEKMSIYSAWELL